MSNTITPTVFYRTLNVEGLGIFYREAGPRDAPTVLLLHGFPSSSHMFRNLIPMLADKYHVVAYGEALLQGQETFYLQQERLTQAQSGGERFPVRRNDGPSVDSLNKSFRLVEEITQRSHFSLMIPIEISITYPVWHG